MSLPPPDSLQTFHRSGWLVMIMGGVTLPKHQTSCVMNKMDDDKADSEGTAVILLKRREKQRETFEQQKISEVLVLLIHHYKLP